MKYIIAGNISEYHEYRHNRLRENPLVDLKYVKDTTSLLGQNQVHGAFIGTWYTRPDILDILYQLLLIKSITLEKFLEFQNMLPEKLRR